MRIKLFLFSLLAVIVFSTCETDIDITGEYKKIPVVYGILDLSVDTQFVLINRTFLGNGDALEAAQVEDSMLYTDVDAKLYYGTGVDSYVSLTETRRCDKDLDGAFFAPCYTVYYVTSAELWPGWSPGFAPSDNQINRTYRIEVIADNELIEAETQLASARGNGSGVIFFPAISDASTVNLVSNFGVGGSTYQSSGLRMHWNQSNNDIKNAIKHKAKVRFNYVEVMTNGDRIAKHVDIPIATVNEESASSGEEFNFPTSGEVLYQRVGQAIEANDNVLYREIGQLDYILEVAGVDLSTYIDIGDPVSSVGQSRPSFSNINDGDGIGVFSTRDTYTRTKDLYTEGLEADLREMVEGQYTSGHCFCDPTNVSVDYSCDNNNTHCQ